MQTRLALLSWCALIAAHSAYAGCVLPPSPNRLPNGSTATDDEMQVAVSVMSQYETDVNNYLKCLQFEVSQKLLSDAERARLSAEALDRHQATITLFNAQMRLYMAR